jgi:hypothetical protein
MRHFRLESERPQPHWNAAFGTASCNELFLSLTISARYAVHAAHVVSFGICPVLLTRYLSGQAALDWPWI